MILLALHSFASFACFLQRPPAHPTMCETWPLSSMDFLRSIELGTKTTCVSPCSTSPHQTHAPLKAACARPNRTVSIKQHRPKAPRSALLRGPVTQKNQSRSPSLWFAASNASATSHPCSSQVMGWGAQNPRWCRKGTLFDITCFFPVMLRHRYSVGIYIYDFLLQHMQTQK